MSRKWESFRVYREEGKSAHVETVSKRPPFRNQRMMLESMSTLAKANASLLSITENIDFSTPQDKLFPGVHKSPVNKEIFDTVQANLKRNGGMSETMNPRPKRHYLLKGLVENIELGKRWLEEILAVISVKDEAERVAKKRQNIQQHLLRMGRTYIDGLFDDAEYSRQKRMLELELESLPEVQAAEEAGKLLQDLPQLWAKANLEEQRKLLVSMLDAVYIDTKHNLIVAVKPEPPFKPVFQVATQREGSAIQIINGTENNSPVPSVFLVEAGESRTPRPKEATQNILQA